MSDRYLWLGKVRELLAQGINIARFNERNLEQERIERRRLVPPHMHINLDLIEFAHLVCAMLLEVPNMAFDQWDLRRKIISRPFRKLLEHYDRQIFVGPPENTRDHIMAASRALSKGEWQQCVELVMKLPAWKMITNDEKVREMLKRKIQEEGLRTYLFAYSTFYESFSQAKLAENFELHTNDIHSLVSKMMINEELHASWDQPSQCIIMRKIEPSRLQSLALQCADKISAFVEQNERFVDYKAGGGVKKEDRKDQPAGERRDYQDRAFNDQRRRYYNPSRTSSQPQHQQQRLQTTGGQRPAYGQKTQRY